MSRKHEHLPSKAAIAALVGGVALWDMACPKGETISEGTSHLRDTKFGKYVVPFVIVTTALHLLEAIPEELDWLHQITKLKEL